MTMFKPSPSLGPCLREFLEWYTDRHDALDFTQDEAIEIAKSIIGGIVERKVFSFCGPEFVYRHCPQFISRGEVMDLWEKGDNETALTLIRWGSGLDVFLDNALRNYLDIRNQQPSEGNKQ